MKRFSPSVGYLVGSQRTIGPETAWTRNDTSREVIAAWNDEGDGGRTRNLRIDNPML